jgi:hypothetical protein
MKEGVGPITKEEVMLPIEMIPASELPVSELTDAELNVVCGGLFNFTNVIAANTGANVAAPVVALNGIVGPSAVANIAQGLNQANFSALFAQGSII